MNAVLALACLSWSLMHPSPGLQPMTVAMTLFFFRMNSKARAGEGPVRRRSRLRRCWRCSPHPPSERPR